MTFLFDDREYEIHVKRSRALKSVLFEAKAYYLNVKAPQNCADKNILELLEKNRKTVEKLIGEMLTAAEKGIVPLSEKEKNELLAKATMFFRKRVYELKEKVGGNAELVDCRFVTGYYGICRTNIKGNKTRLTFNPILMYARPSAIDYVIYHELAHSVCVGQNHNKKFYWLLEKWCPNYKDEEKWIKEEFDHGWKYYLP